MDLKTLEDIANYSKHTNFPVSLTELEDGVCMNHPQYGVIAYCNYKNDLKALAKVEFGDREYFAMLDCDDVCVDFAAKHKGDNSTDIKYFSLLYWIQNISAKGFFLKQLAEFCEGGPLRNYILLYLELKCYRGGYGFNEEGVQEGLIGYLDRPDDAFTIAVEVANEIEKERLKELTGKDNYINALLSIPKVVKYLQDDNIMNKLKDILNRNAFKQDITDK